MRVKPWPVAGIVALAALLTWSSWQPPQLSDYAPPSRFVVLDAPQLQANSDSARMQAQATALPGVTACAIRPAKLLLVVAFNPDSIDEARLCERLRVTVQPTPPPNPLARQCPVPAGYVLALEKVRFALNLRRLFLHV